MMDAFAGRWLTPQGIANAALLGLAIAAVAAAGALLGSPSMLNTVTNMMTVLVGVMAIALFSGNSGALSFGHVAFMALGAQVSATLTMAPALKAQLFPALPAVLLQYQAGFATALVLTAVLVGLFALATGLAIVRLTSATIPIATLGLLIIVNSLIVGADGITRGSQAVYGIPKSVDIAVASAIAALVACGIALFKESAAGLALRATREDEAAAAAVGVDVARLRLLAWVLSGAVAALAGALIAHTLSVFSPKDFYLDLTFSLIVMLIVGGVNSVSGALVGTLLVTGMIEVLRRLENGFSLGPVEVPQIFGLTTIGLSLLIMAVLYYRPGGLLGYRELADLLPGFLRSGAPEAPAAMLPAAQEAAGKHTLRVSAVSKLYGGVTALQDVSIDVSSGEILGLIGPNGSGKSTLLACISGTQSASSGSIRMDGKELAGLPAFVVAQSGIARNFQSIRLFANMTVLENVLVAVLANDRAMTQKAARAKAMGLLDRLAIAGLAQRRSGDLAYGQQRRVEIARALALEPRFLLLDEPAAGMNEAETGDLLRILADTMLETSIGLVIVDHDMPLIMRLCHRLVVLNRGAVLAVGPPLQIQNDETVREAYFGRRRSGKGRNITMQPREIIA
ncbi:MAG: branched-chain amino acid ABC transporter ATP-binding protein/permease [Parvibaculaceae bacterium]